MNLAVFVMLRNEDAILRPFLDQLDEFFDTKILVDHESNDKTPSILEERAKTGYAPYKLKAAGYPQSRLANHFVRDAFEKHRADWLFFLDCDEFLPFANHSELIAALEKVSGDAACLYWRNVVPDDLSGTDIFSGSFSAAKQYSIFKKIAIPRRTFQRHPFLKVYQGYHGVTDADGKELSAEVISTRGLYHIPVQSAFRFAYKIRASANRVLSDPASMARGDGFHWINYHRDIESRGVQNFDFRTAAIDYSLPADLCDAQSERLDFAFPYVKSPYQEDIASIFDDLYRVPERKSAAGDDFVLYDHNGVIVTNSNVSDDRPGGDTPMGKLALGNDPYSDYFEPLFSLPMKLPVSTWTGHIPFQFVLFRLMRPAAYVELGVHFGAGLISAATAARSYRIPTRIYGVDNWRGEQYAGSQQGDDAYTDLLGFMSAQFRNVQLIRAHFDEAVRRFQPGSIDILHIDGPHSYDAVKNDFLAWLPKVSSNGVILLHDTRVHGDGYGVHRLWNELEAKFTTLHFEHSRGLGVVFLNPSYAPLEPLTRLASDKGTADLYKSLVADVAGLLPGRMAALTSDWAGGASAREQTLELALDALQVNFNYLESEALASVADLEVATRRPVRHLISSVRR